MARAAVVFFALLMTGADLSGQSLKIKLTPQPAAAAKADGVIGENEYQFKAIDPGTGIEVRASADSANLYLALKSPGTGWLAVGLGSSGMNGAVMAIAIKDAQGQWTVEQHLGKSLFRHSRVDKPNLVSKAAWQEDGKTCLEFSIPLQYAVAKTLAPGTNTPFILAYHKDKAGLSKHSKKSSGLLSLAKQ
jgi:hypothetical protein